MRVCLVYDCLYPYTVGGAERWYRSLGERLAAEGHEVTYLTLRQWETKTEPQVLGVDVRPVGPRMQLYSRRGRRRILPPLRFGWGVLLHVLRHGRGYDVVHTASFPYFSLLAIALCRPLGRYRVVVDWHEVWSEAYWREYLGGFGGRIGWAIQSLCARVNQHAFCFSRLHAQRLREEGLRGEIRILPGAYLGTGEEIEAQEPATVILFAGRHIPEKRVPAILPALLEARKHLPALRAVILGDGPERPKLLRLINDLELEDAVDAPGFVFAEMVQDTMARALCVLLPSRREGYGLIVIEAAACGTPSIVVAGPDNAAVELISEGENGFVAPSASAEDLARAIARVHAAGEAIRESTAVWFSRNAERLSLDNSLAVVVAGYGT